MQAASTFSLQWMSGGNMSKWYSTIQAQIRHFLSRSSHFWKKITLFHTEKSLLYKSSVFPAFSYTFSWKAISQTSHGQLFNPFPSCNFAYKSGQPQCTGCCQRSLAAWQQQHLSTRQINVHLPFINFCQQNTNMNYWEKNVKPVTKLRWSKMPIFSHNPFWCKINKWTVYISLPMLNISPVNKILYYGRTYLNGGLSLNCFISSNGSI